MADDKTNGEKPKTKRVRKKKQIRSPAKISTAFGLTDKTMGECLDVIRQYRKKCRVFRQRFLDLKSANRITKARILREFITVLVEMEKDAGSAAKKLKNLLPQHKPLTQSDLVVHLAGRITRP